MVTNKQNWAEVLKRMISNSNNIFLWHKSEDIKQKEKGKLIFKIAVDFCVTFSSYA